MLAENEFKIIILAAGHGKRMGQSALPKVLIPLKGKPIIQYLLDAIKLAGVATRPVIVVGQKAEMVKQALGTDYDYVYQTEQLGTGHAVLSTSSMLEGKAANIMVLYGDHPFVRAKTIEQMMTTHLSGGSVLTMATTTVPDFNDWRATFNDFSRILRNAIGQVIGVVEKKDATAEQLAILEINPCYFCFKSEWLWPNLLSIKNNNAQKEYYLPDLVSIACKEKLPITTVQVEPREALGVNTVEQLGLLESF